MRKRVLKTRWILSSSIYGDEEEMRQRRETRDKETTFEERTKGMECPKRGFKGINVYPWPLARMTSHGTSQGLDL